MFSTRIAYVTRGGGRFTLRVADADGEGGQVALNSPEPIISPAWSPERPRARLRVVREPEGGGLHAGRRDRQRAARSPTSAARTARRPGRPTARRWPSPCRAMAGSQLYLIGRDGEQRAPPDDEPGDRHRAGVRARRQDDLLRQRPRRRPADLPDRRRRRQRRARDLQRRLQHQPGDQPRRPHAGLHLALRAMRSGCTRMDLGAGGAADRADRHQRRREPELRAERPADHLRHPRPGPRCVDDDHAGWQNQGSSRCRRPPTCASRSGARSAADIAAPPVTAAATARRSTQIRPIRRRENHETTPAHSRFHLVAASSPRSRSPAASSTKLDTDVPVESRTPTPGAAAAPPAAARTGATTQSRRSRRST